MFAAPVEGPPAADADAGAPELFRLLCPQVFFENANHWLYLEEPDKFNKRMCNLLALKACFKGLLLGCPVSLAGRHARRPGACRHGLSTAKVPSSYPLHPHPFCPSPFPCLPAVLTDFATTGFLHTSKVLHL